MQGAESFKNMFSFWKTKLCSLPEDQIMLFWQSKNLVMLCFLVASALTVQVRPASGGMVIVDPGYDLLYTVNAVYDFQGAGGLNNVPFVGVPIPSFDFGAGAVNVGLTDTILQRMSGVVLPGYDPLDPSTLASATIGLKMVALSLRSASAIDWSFFGGIANEYVSASLVQDLGSTMTIYNDFTFDSMLSFEIALTGAISSATITQSLNFTQAGASWGRIPTFGDVLIDGVNYNLNNNQDINTDFFAGLAEHGPAHIHDTVDVNHVPEPSSVVVFGLGLLSAGIVIRKLPRKVNAR